MSFTNGHPLSSAQTWGTSQHVWHCNPGGLKTSLAPQQKTNAMGQMAGFLPLDNGPVKGTAFPTRAGLGWTYHSPAHWRCAMASSCGTTNSNQPTWSLFLGPHPFATFFFFIIIYYFIKYLIKKSKHKHPPTPNHCIFLTSLLFSPVLGCKCLRTGVVLPSPV